MKSHSAESAGVYTLNDQSGTISGTLTYVVDSELNAKERVPLQIGK
jgi:hypothetical protein